LFSSLADEESGGRDLSCDSLPGRRITPRTSNVSIPNHRILSNPVPARLFPGHWIGVTPGCGLGKPAQKRYALSPVRAARGDAQGCPRDCDLRNKQVGYLYIAKADR